MAWEAGALVCRRVPAQARRGAKGERGHAARILPDGDAQGVVTSDTAPPASLVQRRALRLWCWSAAACSVLRRQQGDPAGLLELEKARLVRARPALTRRPASAPRQTARRMSGRYSRSTALWRSSRWRCSPSADVLGRGTSLRGMGLGGTGTRLPRRVQRRSLRAPPTFWAHEVADRSRPSRPMSWAVHSGPRPARWPPVGHTDQPQPRPADLVAHQRARTATKSLDDGWR
jgi:hypothetical protein